MPVGLAMPRPAMSGAEPCTDSKYAQPLSPKLPEGATPRPPATSPATSERMSPYWFMHRTTSSVVGNRTIRRAASSTWKCSNVRSGYVRTVSSTVWWNRPSVCGSTLDFVTQVTLPARPRSLRRKASSHAKRAMRTAPSRVTILTAKRPLRYRSRPRPNRSRSAGSARASSAMSPSRPGYMPSEFSRMTTRSMPSESASGDRMPT